MTNNMIEIKNKYTQDPYQILEHPGMGICLFYPNGKILFVNEKFASVYQSNIDDMVDHRIQEFCHYTVQNLADFLKNIVNDLPVNAQEMYSMGNYYQYKIQGIYKNNRLVLVLSLVDITQYKRIELALQQTNKQLEQYKQLDRVTKLNNFCAFTAKIQEIYDAKEGDRVGMVLLDIDHFNRFMHENGFEYGESALKTISACLARFAQSQQISLYFLEGNEFIFILPKMQNWSLYTFAEQVRCEIFNLNIYFSQGAGHRLTCSLVINTVLTGSAFDIDFFLVRLKQVMQQAKFQGGNCWLDAGTSSQ